MGMVYIVICQKCGEAFESDTASTESICPRCTLDTPIDKDMTLDQELLNFYPELWVIYE